MADLRTQIFIGMDEHAATAQLADAIADGSFPVLPTGRAGVPAMWITHHQIIPGGMRQPFYELHVTAWVESPNGFMRGDDER